MNQQPKQGNQTNGTDDLISIRKDLEGIQELLPLLLTWWAEYKLQHPTGIGETNHQFNNIMMALTTNFSDLKSRFERLYPEEP